MQASFSRSVIGPAGQAGGGSKQIDAFMFVKAFFSSFWESAKSWFC
jgi:hypothetical protein